MKTTSLRTMAWLTLGALFIAACGTTGSSEDETAAGAEETTAEEAEESTEQEAEEATAPEEDDWDILSVAEVALYDAPDRRERLIWQAQQEGALMVYTAQQTEETLLFFDAFLEEYPELSDLDMDQYRAGTADLTNRIISEYASGVHTPDVITYSGPYVEQLASEGVLQEIKSPATDAYEPPFDEQVTPETIPLKLQLYVQAYNTDALSEDELPGSYEDLITDEFADVRVGVVEDSPDWYGVLYDHWGEEKTHTIFGGLRDHGITPVRGATVLTELLGAGEYDIALRTLINPQLQETTPIDWFFLDPLVYRVNRVGLAREAPNPAAGMLFLDFLAGEGGATLIASFGEFPVYPGIGNLDETIPEGVELVPITFEYVERLPEFLPDWEEFILR